MGQKDIVVGKVAGKQSIAKLVQFYAVLKGYDVDACLVAMSEFVLLLEIDQRSFSDAFTPFLDDLANQGKL